MIKDKRKLKNYIHNDYEEVGRNCYYLDNKYVISNKISIVCLNEDNGLNVVKEDNNNRYCRAFRYYIDEFKKAITINEIIPNFEEEYYYINEKWGIGLKNVKEIKNLIKGDVFTIKRIDKEDLYILEIFNSKTGEAGYLLPCKRY